MGAGASAENGKLSYVVLRYEMEKTITTLGKPSKHKNNENVIVLQGSRYVFNPFPPDESEIEGIITGDEFSLFVRQINEAGIRVLVGLPSVLPLQKRISLTEKAILAEIGQCNRTLSDRNISFDLRPIQGSTSFIQKNNVSYLHFNLPRNSLCSTLSTITADMSIAQEFDIFDDSYNNKPSNRHSDGQAGGTSTTTHTAQSRANNISAAFRSKFKSTNSATGAKSTTSTPDSGMPISSEHVSDARKKVFSKGPQASATTSTANNTTTTQSKKPSRQVIVNHPQFGEVLVDEPLDLNFEFTLDSAESNTSNTNHKNHTTHSTTGKHHHPHKISSHHTHSQSTSSTTNKFKDKDNKHKSSMNKNEGSFNADIKALMDVVGPSVSRTDIEIEYRNAGGDVNLAAQRLLSGNYDNFDFENEARETRSNRTRGASAGNEEEDFHNHGNVVSADDMDFTLDNAVEEDAEQPVLFSSNRK